MTLYLGVMAHGFFFQNQFFFLFQILEMPVLLFFFICDIWQIFFMKIINNFYLLCNEIMS